MKTKFLLCMRPSVTETDDGDYKKPPPPAARSSYTTLSGNISTSHNRDFQRRKRVASEINMIRQLSIKSNSNISENQTHKDSPKISRSVSEIFIKYSDEESVSLRNPSNKVNGGPQSNSGAYLMVCSLFFTILLGRCFGILCTLILVCLLYPHRKNNGDDGRKLESLVVKSAEKGLVKKYNKRVIMDGLLERKIHYRENNKVFS